MHDPKANPISHLDYCLYCGTRLVDHECHGFDHPNHGTFNVKFQMFHTL